MVHAEVVQRPGASLSAEALMAFAREHLAGYKVPRSVKFIAEPPHGDGEDPEARAAQALLGGPRFSGRLGPPQAFHRL